MPPTVSVVMPVYNGERFLPESMASVLGQTFADFEFIIVDDGSTDASVEIVREYERRDARVRQLQLPRNLGQASAINRGIEQASGDYVAMLDCDDICLPDRLRIQVNFLNAHPHIGVLGCTMWVVDEGLEPLFCYTVPEDHARIVWNLFYGWSVAGASTMIRREILVSAGGYEGGRNLSNDMEMWSRLAGRARFANLPDISMFYRRHSQAKGTVNVEQRRAAVADIMRRMLTRLWGEAPEATVERFLRVRKGAKDFRRAERKLLRAEMTRLIDSFLEAGWVEADERPQLQSAMESELRRIRPRRRHFWKRLL